ncbi:MAG: hypothetical protein F6K40_00615 [Okeania sp. SIO3I5]|uniref:hypothetical protein n=1 Tax=Okeania sp. SIO3I5 TaxID=2607805 RepID=UPI0013B90DA7|nr:hypothetical protein [Okeania sp. SIO3I5]NEQ34890.1 hypothetical protein [Okeania sp. SIO3I5]
MSEEEQQKLIGTKCEFFKDRFLKVSISLNQERGINKDGRKEPVLVQLKPTEKSGWYTQNIVFLQEDSHISFTLESEGPCGYGFKIFTMEKNIIKKLYAGNEGDEERIKVQVSRYQNDASSIRVKDFQYFENAENNISDNILETSLVSIITWPIFGYDQGYYRYRPGVPKASIPMGYKKSQDPKNKDLGKYFKSKDFKKYVKSISIKGGDFSRKAVESPINDSNYIVKGAKSKERFNELITNVVEDNDKSDFKTNGSIHMLFFILNKDENDEYEKIEDFVTLEQ